MFSSSFIVFSQYILFVGFQYVLSSIFFTTCFLSFSPLSSIGFCTISSGFLHFHTFSILNINPRVLPVSFIFRSFLCHFLSLLSHFPALSLYFSSMFTASSWFAPSSRSIFQGIFHGLFLAFAPFSSVFQGILYDFLWSLSCFPAVSLYFPIHPHGLSGHQKGGPRGNRYPTVSKLPSGT